MMRNNMRCVLLQLILYWQVITTLDVTEETTPPWSTTADFAKETEESTDFRFVAETTLAEEDAETETIADLVEKDLLRRHKSLDDKNATISDDQACGPPPQVEKAYPTGSTEGTFPVGSVVAYACEFGYVAAGSKRSTSCHQPSATQQPEWTRIRLKCNPRSCGDPGYVVNGQVIGSLFTFPHNVTVHCDEGYERTGQRTSFCQANGEWSGTLGTCERVLCSIPTSPLHGRSIFSSLEFGSELRYECEKGFRLDRKESRFCTQKGRWSGLQPNCSEMHCDPPIAPQSGSVQILDPDLKVGSLILFACDEGRVLVGSARSTCSIDGHWVFPAPKCVAPCGVPRIPNGEMGKYVEKFRSTHFKKSRVGDTFDENEEHLVRCYPDYFIAGTKSVEANIFCLDGNLSENLTCVSSSCAEDPPSTENGYIYNKSNKHGGTVTYLCNSLYEKKKSGNVTCLFSQWEGITPVCEKADCLLSELNDLGLVESPRVYKNGYSYDPSCKSGYETSKVENKLLCRNGTWTGYTPACQPASCRSGPPWVGNGRGIPDCRTHDCTATYSCNPSFSLEGSSTVRCLYGLWEGDPPKCISVKCIVPRISDGEIGQQVTDYYGKRVYKKIRRGKEMQGDAKYILRCNANYHVPGRRINETSFSCTNGVFSETLQCASSTCVEDPPPARNAYVFSKRNEHGGTVVYHCHEKFEKKKYGNVTCFFGLWEGVTPTCEGALTSAKEKEIPVISDHHTTVRSTTAVPTHIETFEPKPECTCLYYTPDIYLKAYANDKNLESGSKISRGTRVTFYCQNFEFRKLVGQTETVCENCGERLYYPSCREPNYATGDTVVGLGGDVFPGNGLLEVERGGNLKLMCYALRSQIYGYPTWAMPSSLNSRIDYWESGSYRLGSLEIMSFDERHSGEYTCSGRNLISTILNVRVVEPKQRCPLFPESESYTISYVAGSAHFHCKDANQKLTGASSLQCDSNGQWSGDAPHCIDVECPELVRSQNLTIYYTDGRRLGSTATFHCFAPLKLNGRASLKCLGNGSWSADTPSCMYVECPALVQSQNLTIYYTDGRRLGSTATFHCFAPLKLNGRASLKCLGNGSWSADTPSCILPDCSIDKLYSLMADSMYPVMEDVAGDIVPYGTNLTLQCEDGQKLTNPAIATCGAGGKWIIPNVRCISGCEPVSKVTGSSLIVEPQQDFYRLGEQISLSCPPGLELTSEIEVVMCFGEKWSEIDIPDCK